VFLNPAAMAALAPGGLPGDGAPSLQLQSALALRAVSVGGTVNAPGAPLAVMDIGAAQDLFGAAGRLSRIDLRLQPGTDRAAFIARAAAAGGGDGRRARRRGRAGEQPVARLPREPHGAGTGGAVHRCFPGVFRALAQRGAARAAVRAAGRARPDPAPAPAGGAGGVAAARCRRQRSRHRAGHGAGGAGAAPARRRPGRRLLCRRGTAPAMGGRGRAALRPAGRGRCRGGRLVAGARGATTCPPRRRSRAWALRYRPDSTAPCPCC
jgi:hypothetical protein